KRASADSLSGDVFALAERAAGFAANNVTMWLDQARLNRNRYFGNYWIHHNSESDLANIESALIDLRFTREGMSEHRWFKMGDGGQGLGLGVMSDEQIAGFMKFAPANAHLVQVHAATAAEDLSSIIEQSLFGALPEESWSPPEIPDRTRSRGDEDQLTRFERYSRLDSRFDIDVDDEQAPRRGPAVRDQGSSKPDNQLSASAFAKGVAPLLASVSTTSYCELVRSQSEAGKPFVRFERAIVAQLKPDAAVNRDALERAIVDELRARFVVAGTRPRLDWQDEGAIRFVAQSLLEQGAAYSVSGNYLVLASSKEFASDILQAAKNARPAAERVGSPVDFYALIRVAAAKPAFDALMSKLDGRDQPTLSHVKKDDEEREVKFFSENISSLVAASAIREVRLTRQSGPIATEQVYYLW
ncbi:MAG TPA: hypothetical protein VLG74_11255, partial [Blastocatellia bacterium]|nr:hypothetical protein [Blastocatellia bacterium]